MTWFTDIHACVPAYSKLSQAALFVVSTPLTFKKTMTEIRPPKQKRGGNLLGGATQPWYLLLTE